MLLSDELIEIGHSANKRSNYSLYEAAKRMMNLMDKRRQQGEMVARLNITVDFVVKTFNKEGYPYGKFIVQNNNSK